jgi:pyruvate dehydrogenase E2 component (dihydrolipoyllysine-residue acetyltransferase)
MVAGSPSDFARVRLLTGIEQPVRQLVDVTMPRLSDSMEEATVLRWLKLPGEAVEKGEPLVEVETDKATVVYEAELDGVLSEISVGESESAALGAVIARLAVDSGGDTAAAAAPAPPERRQRSRPRATPVARRLAGELGIDLDALAGSGPGGRIVEADVRGAQAAAPATAPARPGGRGEETLVELTPTQRTIAERMSASRSQIPEFTLHVEADMERAVQFRDDLRELGRSPLPSLNDLLVRAAALALREFPALNAGFVDGRVVRFGRINIGIAVAADDALLVPTIFDADRRSVFEIAATARELVEKIRSRQARLDDLRDGTFTVSNLGMFGIRSFEAVINPPQAAILAAGVVERRAVAAADGSIVARSVCDLTLACDHRVVYGAEAAAFLQRLRNLLEHPAALLVA